MLHLLVNSLRFEQVLIRKIIGQILDDEWPVVLKGDVYELHLCDEEGSVFILLDLGKSGLSDACGSDFVFDGVLPLERESRILLDLHGCL
jgi:hypothetical protein